MDNLVNVAIERFNKIKDNAKEDEFKTYVIKFFRAYNFLIQIYPIKKTSLYEMYIYLGGLIKKFPKDKISKVELNNLLSLDFYKLKRMNGDEINGEDLSLSSTVAQPLQGYSEGSSRTKDKEEVDLNSLIQRINDLFGLDLSDEDRLAFFDQPLEAHKKNEDLKDIAIVNSYDEFEEQFKKGFFLKMMVDKRSTNEEMFNKIITDNSLKSYLLENMSRELYRYFNV
jgi:type I restriction enzyme, R subunit